MESIFNYFLTFRIAIYLLPCSKCTYFYAIIF
uniref:Uncharacterized protein n=1 Tax=CrAss-like virus sp. ctYsL76 TaxID=2826826 RepID=A0A8S5QN45_9CAUD|nr:MAG TPA: hypothetical protein [CrAss-like virus sp. ctYsL76]